MWTILISKEGMVAGWVRVGGRGWESCCYDAVCKYSDKKLLNSFRNIIIVCAWKGVRSHLGKIKKYQTLRGPKYINRYKWAVENEGQP